MHRIIEKPGYELNPDLQKLWQVQLTLLEKFIDVCQRNGLRCWADGGTMLGAVRHHGFIPWDDDIDVAMMRDDYDRLQQIGPREFQKPFFFQSAYTDIDYHRGHAQLRMDGTAAIRPSDCFQPFHQGIFIDIFPIDGIPEDRKRAEEAVRQGKRILRFLKAKNTNILYSGRIGLIGRKWLARREVKRRSWTAIYAEAEEQFRQFPIKECQLLGELSLSGLGLVFKKSFYDQTVWLDFEDLKVPVPACYDAYLRNQYGDNYMTPMCDSSIHGELIIDTERDYRELLPEVQRMYRKSLWNRFTKKIKKTK